MNRVFSLAAALAVAALAALPGAAAAVDKSAHKNPASTDVRQVFLQRNALTLAILEADFPRDYEELMASVARLGNAPRNLDSKLSALFSQLTQIRRKYADRMRFAPEPQQRELIGLLGSFMARVQIEAGPEICGRFARDGSGALFERGVASRFSSLIDRQSAAYFTAVVGAIENPEAHEPVLQDDWAAVFARMEKDGYPRSFVATIAKSAADDPALCPALSAMLVSAALMDEPEASRFRADFSTNVTGY